MRVLRSAAALVLVMASLAALLGCQDRDDELLVFAAASLADVLEPLGQTFTLEHDVSVSFSFGGSTTLAQQLVRGAGADLFISAGPGPMDSLVDRALLAPELRVDLLTNQLVLAGSPEREESLSDPHTLLSAAISRIAIADPQLAPAGRYAQSALQGLGLWDELKPKLVFGADVRAALTYVEAGNVDVGIVYRTDVKTRPGLQVLSTLPNEAYPQIVYPGAVLQGSGHKEAARAFLAFLQSEGARKTFRQYGFTPLE